MARLATPRSSVRELPRALLVNPHMEVFGSDTGPYSPLVLRTSIFGRRNVPRAWPPRAELRLGYVARLNCVLCSRGLSVGATTHGEPNGCPSTRSNGAQSPQAAPGRNEIAGPAGFHCPRHMSRQGLIAGKRPPGHREEERGGLGVWDRAARGWLQLAHPLRTAVIPVSSSSSSSASPAYSLPEG